MPSREFFSLFTTSYIFFFRYVRSLESKTSHLHFLFVPSNLFLPYLSRLTLSSNMNQIIKQLYSSKKHCPYLLILRIFICVLTSYQTSCLRYFLLTLFGLSWNNMQRGASLEDKSNSIMQRPVSYTRQGTWRPYSALLWPTQTLNRLCVWN